MAVLTQPFLTKISLVNMAEHAVMSNKHSQRCSQYD